MTIISLLQSACQKHSNRTALRQKSAGTWKETTYGQLWAASDRVAAGLINSGFKPGNHAAILAPSSTRWVIVYIGILKAGGVAVPVDKELKSAELRHVLGDCDARFVFTDQPYLDTVVEIADSLPLLGKIIALHSSRQKDELDTASAKALESLIEEWQTIIAANKIPAEQISRLEGLASKVHRALTVKPSGRAEQHESDNPFARSSILKKSMIKQKRLIAYEDLEHDALLPPLTRSSSDTAVILYTSGTTGRSKGAMLSHGNIVSNIKGAASHFRLNDSIHTLSFLPINHVFEQVCGILLPLSLGGKVSFCESLKKLGENLTEVKPTFFLAVPAVYRMFLDRIMKNIDSKRLSHLLYSFPLTRPIVASKVRQAFGAGTVFISGGAALDPAISSGLSDLGFSIYQGYGITETSPVITAESPDKRRPGTVGHTLPDVTVRIDSPNEDGIGEIVVKGPNVMQGYYKNPVATAEVLNDGWYRTGDLGKVESTGYLTISGRVKNLIVTPNGKNVYPEEVENELLKSEFISECMVYGHKAGGSAEDVHAIIFPNQEALDNHARANNAAPMTVADVQAIIKREVLTACNGLADYKRVKKFTLRDDEFPKTTTRKIKRFEVDASISMH
ncbi:MAG: AMP-binding protein [Geobacteraceae bacterium]|nr:AMP-binding protein [Geobacteraceae bacterium]